MVVVSVLCNILCFVYVLIMIRGIPRYERNLLYRVSVTYMLDMENTETSKCEIHIALIGHFPGKEKNPSRITSVATLASALFKRAIRSPSPKEPSVSPL